MTWQEKMNIVIGEVLGEGYEVKFIDDNTFEVCFVDAMVIRTHLEGTQLCNHWRKHISDAIELIIRQQTIKALSKL